MAIKFPPLNFLFQLAFFALLLCLDEGYKEKEYKESQLLVKEGIGTGNLGAWMHWTQVEYMIFDHCMPRPEKLRDDPIGSYRLHVYCSTRFCTDAEEAKIFICYPSTLDPEALPDEDVSEGKMPSLRAPRQFWVQTDPDHEISKTCTELMEKCSNDTNCKQKVGDRVLHGFSIKREKDKFVIEMPFGKNGIGKCFNVSDNNAGRFYMNFGNSEDSMHTYVIPGDISNIWPRDPLRGMMVIDAENENAMKNFKSHMDVGMPLEIAQHLWMLGIDLLGTVEQQKLHFFTKCEPKEIEFTTCKKADRNLAADRDYRKKFINAMYFMPNALDIGKLENMHEEGSHVEPKPPAEKLINVNEMAGHEHIEKLSIPLPNIEFFLSGWVPEKATNFSILLYHGIKQLTEKLGQKVMEIVVAFDGKTIKECNVKSFLSESMIQFCNINDQGKPVAFTPGEKFWFWMKIHDGQMEISLNCNERTFKIGVIPYSSKNYIKFTGNLELVIDGKVRGKDVAVEMIRKESFVELMGKSPVLVVLKINLVSNQKELLILTSKFALDKKTDQTKVEILLINTIEPNNSYTFNIEKKSCSNFEAAADVKSCIENNITTCLSIEWADGKPQPFCLSSETFVFTIFCDEQKNAQNQKPEKKILHMYLNQNEVRDIPNDDHICRLNNMQIKGELEYPVSGNHLVYLDSEKIHELELNDDQKYVNIHLLWLGKQTNVLANNLENEIIIDLLCQFCFFDLLDKISLQLKIMMANSTILAESFERIAKKDPSTGKNIVTRYPPIATKNSTININENPFWFKIFISKKSDNSYKIYQNGAHVMDITLPLFWNKGDGLNFQGNIALFNNPIVFPYIFRLKHPNPDAKINENSTFTLKWRILNNAELFEFFVAKGQIENIEKLGTTNQHEFDKTTGKNVESDDDELELEDKLFMHIRAHKNEENGKICISSSLIKKIANCSQFFRNQNGEDLKMLDPKMFKEDNVHKLEITFNKDYATIKINKLKSIKYLIHDNDLLEAWAFVVCVFIVIYFTVFEKKINWKKTKMDISSLKNHYDNIYGRIPFLANYRDA